ncbi:MAG: hypothetical protein KTR25_02905 [Myxococcales bacterium]|nr:hypothetical protein [Myxococcales bacterium]
MQTINQLRIWHWYPTIGAVLMIALAFVLAVESEVVTHRSPSTGYVDIDFGADGTIDQRVKARVADLPEIPPSTENILAGGSAR